MPSASPIRIAATALFILGWGVFSPARAGCLTIGIGTGGAFAEERAALVETIFNKAGLCAKPLLAPSPRLNLMEKKGQLDGNAWRDDAYLATHGAVVKVPTPVEHFRGSLFWLRDQEDPSHMAGATIGILMGREWPREALKGLPVAIFEANDYTQLFRLTESKRLQGFVMPTYLFDKLDLDRPKYQSRVIRVVPLYLAIQERHKSAIPALNNAIKALRNSGAIPE